MVNPWEHPTTSQAGYDFTKKNHSDTYDAINPLKSTNQVGHRVFIVGASKGVGNRTAIAIAESGASYIGLGARSPLDDLTAEFVSGAKKAGHKALKVLTVKLDVLDQASIDEAAKLVEQEFGGLDILINNAGWLETATPIVDSDPKDWWYTMEVNIKGVYLSTRAFLPVLLKGGMKSIINLSSIGAHAIRPGSEYGDKGIVAYPVHPGGIMTEMGNRMPKETHYRTWDMPELMSRKDEIVKGDKLKVRMVL